MECVKKCKGTQVDGQTKSKARSACAFIAVGDNACTRYTMREFEFTCLEPVASFFIHINDKIN
jgi:hypothetical protein